MSARKGEKANKGHILMNQTAIPIGNKYWNLSQCSVTQAVLAWNALIVKEIEPWMKKATVSFRETEGQSTVLKEKCQMPNQKI